MLNEDEKSLAAAVLSSRAGYLYVQWVVILGGRSVSRKGSLEACEADSKHENDPGTVLRWLAQLRHNWPSMRVEALQEGSVGLTRHACECVSTEKSASPIRLNASGVCPLERERLFWFSSSIAWSWECRSTLTGKDRHLHIPRRCIERVSSHAFPLCVNRVPQVSLAT